MKKLPLIAIAFLLLMQGTFAQDKAKIKAEANISASAFAKGDYATMADHTYPKVLTMMGGKQAFVQTLNTGIGQMTKQGMSFQKVVIGEPGEIFTAGTELLCLVPETLTVKMQTKYITSTSYLLAISGDKGKTWKFMDTSTATPEEMKTMFPNYNPKLVIPHPSKPVYSDKAP